MPLALSGGDFEGLRGDLFRAYGDPAQRAALSAPARLALTLPPTEAVTAIRPFLADKSMTTRLVGVSALRHIGTPNVIAVITSALKDKDRFVRISAIRALARVGKGKSSVTQALRAATKDKAKDVREVAAKALAELTSEQA
jgi:HEAT repeat protein